MYQYLVNQEKYVENLARKEETKHIVNSLNWYTGQNYDDFNIAMRKNKLLSGEQRDNKDNIDLAFENVPPLETPIVVFKGKHSGQVYSDRSFVSTSLSYNVAKEKFAGDECCVLEITVSPGSKVLPLRTISEKPEEEEILLDRDGIMMVTGNTIRKEDKMKLIYTTYCPEKSKQVKTDEDIEKADKSFDPQLVLEAIIESLKDEDPDFLDDQVIKISYSTVTEGKKISESDLNKIKQRLGI